MSTNSRVMSRDVNHLRADLAASLAFALEGRSQEDLTAAEAIVADVNGYEDTQEALHRVRIHLGVTAFGHVTMFHLYASTSFRGVSEQLTHPRSLREHDLTIYDLAWPPSQLKEQFQDHAVEDPELEQRLENAVAAWRERVEG